MGELHSVLFLLRDLDLVGVSGEIKDVLQEVSM
jgi:hypothetical protein